MKIKSNEQQLLQNTASFKFGRRAGEVEEVTEVTEEEE
jgi:hypothetical protein